MQQPAEKPLLHNRVRYLKDFRRFTLSFHRGGQGVPRDAPEAEGQQVVGQTSLGQQEKGWLGDGCQWRWKS